jgi:Ca2+-binding RTX toxin-like protein
LLIGGAGSDALAGGSSEDILVARSTGYEANDAALMDIMRQWTSKGRLNARVDSLRNSYFQADSLEAAGAAEDPAPVNQLRGGKGGDWFLRLEHDVIFDLDKADIDELFSV